MVSENDNPIDDRLCTRVRALLANHELPREPATQIWGGVGIGEPCDICGQRITSTEMEFELVFPSQQTLRLHRACHAAWEQERRRMRQ